MKRLILLIGLMVLLSACESVDLSKVSDEDIGRVSKEIIVCESPYIRHASGCCIDQNDNSLCDTDEGTNESARIKELEGLLEAKEAELLHAEKELNNKIQILDRVQKELKLKSEREEKFTEQYTQCRDELKSCQSS